LLIVTLPHTQNLCANKATKLGIKTVKLPIGPERLKASTVLTVNQVVEILLIFNETSDWEVTLDRCLPRRKTKEQVAAKHAEEPAS
jgi:tRNA (guanine9-N1)-methyltransferase